MKQFLDKIRFFIILICAGWLLVELFYRLVPNNYTEKHKNVQKAYNKTEILIFGNSHTFYGLNPDRFSNEAFNLSNISQSLFYDKLLFDKHIYRFNKLECVVLNVEYTSLSQDVNAADLQWRKYFYESQMDINTGLVNDFDIRGYSLALAPKFRITVSSLMKFFNEGSLVECSAKGWGRKESVEEEYNNPEMGKNIVTKHEDGSVDFSKNINTIKDIITTCRDKNINVVLVTMPVTSHYADNVNKDKLEKIFNTCTSLDTHYGNVHYLNLFQDKRFSNNDFYDTDHLNVQGAQKCSAILNSYILQL